MKILHILTDSNVGGAGIHLSYLLHDIDHKLFDITVVCPSNSAVIKRLENTRAKIMPLEGLAPDKSFDMGSIRTLVKVIKKIQPEIVHTHASFSGRIAARLAGGCKIIFTRHCLEAVDKPNSLAWKLKRWINNKTCDKVIAVSDAVRENVIASGIPGEKVVTIHNGINMELFRDNFDREAIRKMYKLPKGRLVGVVGRLEKVKGHEHFLKAAAILKDIPQLSDTYFLLIGSGSEEQRLKSLAGKLKIKNRVLFLGYIANVQEIISLLDVMVMPSISEAIGLSLLEGMALEKPCIGTVTGGIPEIIQDGVNGFLVPAADPEALAEKIRTLLENPELAKKMGEEGRRTVKANFASKAMAQKVMELYMSM